MASHSEPLGAFKDPLRHDSRRLTERHATKGRGAPANASPGAPWSLAAPLSSLLATPEYPSRATSTQISSNSVIQCHSAVKMASFEWEKLPNKVAGSRSASSTALVKLDTASCNCPALSCARPKLANVSKSESKPFKAPEPRGRGGEPFLIQFLSLFGRKKSLLEVLELQKALRPPQEKGAKRHSTEAATPHDAWRSQAPAQRLWQRALPP